MLLTIDVGNTNIKLGLYAQNKKIASFRDKTIQSDYKSIILSFLFHENLRQDIIDDCIISCVVPDVLTALNQAIKTIFGKEPIVINGQSQCGLTIPENIKKELGADLLTMSAYTYAYYRKEMIVVSMGTATVLSHISGAGEFKHCIIAPGLKQMAKCLWSNSALLPEFDLEKKDTYLVDNTIDAMTVGVYDGYIGMVKHLITEMNKEIGNTAIVIACGGNGKKVVPYLNIFESYTPDLVSDGLAYLYERYFKK